jgi:hypothetical protein
MSTEVWSEYKHAMSGLTPATLSEGDVPPKPEEEQVDRLLDASDKLGASLTESLADERGDVREMAALQLQAAAAIDIDRANALAAADDGQGLSATLSSGDWTEIDRILSTPTEDGILAVVVLERGFEATAADAGTLEDAVNAAIDAIAGDAAKAATTTTKGITGIPGDALKKAFGDGVEKVFHGLGEKVNWLKRKAIELVLKAVKKLLAVFGSSTEKVREKIGKWLDDLNEEKVKGLLQRLYGVDALKAGYAERLQKAGAIPDGRDQAARKELDTLKAKWHTRTSVIDTVGGIIPFARNWIAGLAPPIGLIAYTLAFALATGYVVLAGGDYLDWRENDGLLDMVEGVGYVVDRAAGAVATP